MDAVARQVHPDQLDALPGEDLLQLARARSVEELAEAAGADVDARSDIWALGVILYTLLAGRLPFLADIIPLPGAVLSLGDVFLAIGVGVGAHARVQRVVVRRVDDPVVVNAAGVGPHRNPVAGLDFAAYGDALPGSVGHLAALRRLTVGPFAVDQAVVVVAQAATELESLALRGRPTGPTPAFAVKAELQQLKSVDRLENVKEIEAALAHGDLSENAEYHAAKEEQ